MKVVFADTFLPSLKKMINRERWYWKVIDFFRYDIGHFYRNLKHFVPLLYNYRPWDATGGLVLLEKHLSITADTLERGHEEESSKDKKIIKMRLTIELLKNVREDNFIDLAEKELGLKVVSDLFEDFTNSEEQEAINKQIFDRARLIEETQWEQIWTNIKGQDINTLEKVEDEGWDESWERYSEWFDGSGLRGWWD